MKNQIKFKVYFAFIFSLNLLLVNAQTEKIDSVKNIEMSFRDKNDFREALLPVPQNAIFKMEGYYLWDPSVIKVKNTYHLFMSRWPMSDVFMKGWQKSQIIRATSKSLFGPYTFAEVVLDPSTHPWATDAVHNPKIIKVGKKFLLYYLGIPAWQTGFAIADKIEGPWQIIDKPVIPTNNPALMVKPDGKLYAVGKFKTKLKPDGTRDAFMQAFTADSLLGPYNLVGGKTSRLPYDFELEDPTIWWANNQINVLCTDWDAKATGVFKAMVFYTSKDGINYKLYSNIPVWTRNESFPLAEGGTSKPYKIERPQVYVNEKGGVEALLVAIEPTSKTESYIVIRPVKNFKPSN